MLIFGNSPNHVIFVAVCTSTNFSKPTEVQEKLQICVFVLKNTKLHEKHERYMAHPSISNRPREITGKSGIDLNHIMQKYLSQKVIYALYMYFFFLSQLDIENLLWYQTEIHANLRQVHSSKIMKFHDTKLRLSSMRFSALSIIRFNVRIRYKFNF